MTASLNAKASAVTHEATGVFFAEQSCTFPARSLNTIAVEPTQEAWMKPASVLHFTQSWGEASNERRAILMSEREWTDPGSKGGLEAGLAIGKTEKPWVREAQARAQHGRSTPTAELRVMANDSGGSRWCTEAQ